MSPIFLSCAYQILKKKLAEKNWDFLFTLSGRDNLSFFL
jgi:hypothetical protein